MLPDGLLQFVRLGRSLGALVFAGTHDGILAVALVVATLGLSFCGLVGHPEHSEIAALAAKQAA